MTGNDREREAAEVPGRTRIGGTAVAPVALKTTTSPLAFKDPRLRLR